MDIFATNIANTSLGLFPQQQQPPVNTVAMAETSVEANGGPGSIHAQVPGNDMFAQTMPQALDVAQLQAVLTESIVKSIQPQIHNLNDSMANEIRSLNSRMEMVDQQFQEARANLVRDSRQAPLQGLKTRSCAGRDPNRLAPSCLKTRQGRGTSLLLLGSNAGTVAVLRLEHRFQT